MMQGAWSRAGADAAEAIERGCAVQTVGFERAMRDIERDPGILQPNPAPQPADLFRRDLEVPKAVHPEPLVPAREAREVEIPSAARSVRKLAEAHGWWVKVTYALGWVLGAKGDTRALTHTVALRMTEKGLDEGVVSTRSLVAVWSVKEPTEGLEKIADVLQRGPVAVPLTGWRFDLAYGWGGGQPHHKLSAAALKETIKEA